MQVCNHCGAPFEATDRFCARCGATIKTDAAGSPQDPLIGRSIGGAYTLLELIGVGGMGRVYRAEQNTLGRTVAVKVIHPHLLGDEQTVARFYTEAKAASRLNHPNSVSIIDFGRTDDGILYLVMEFLQGKDLAMVMHDEGPLPFSRIADVMDGVLGALGEAHALGVVHRDLKPENVILNRFRSGADLVKVVDFGLATIVSGAGSTSITTPGLVCGTPDYMSPEQGKGEQVDGRGDIYSLGVLLYELLTDQLPYSDETPTKVVLRHINDPIPDPNEVAPHRNIPDALATVAVRALSKTRNDRYQTAEEMAAAIREAIREEPSRPSSVGCPSCGAPNPMNMTFCGKCGARLGIALEPEAPPEAPTPVSDSKPAAAPTLSMKGLVGRKEELEILLALRKEAKEGLIWAHLTGDPGSGKTRLLSELEFSGKDEGDTVVTVGASDSRAPIPYYTLRQAVCGLLGISEDELASLGRNVDVFPDPLCRAGLAELYDPVGLPGGSSNDGRVGAVIAATAAVIRLVRERDKRQLMLIVDDLDTIDGLSRKVLARLSQFVSDVPLLVLTAGYTPELPESGVSQIALSGIPPESVRDFVMKSQGPQHLGVALAEENRQLLPLYLEQLSELGFGSEEAIPDRLADVVAMRLDRLDLASRRALQAISVLGDRVELSVLEKLANKAAFAAIPTLSAAGLVRGSQTSVEISHPFIRDLVHASIPAEARRALHQRALVITAEIDAPLEVRAEHGYRAGEPMTALMLLERMGDMALRRGDQGNAVLAYRRALELGRREMLETGDQLLDSAILTFSRKLGEALRQYGDTAGADGVLREALDLAGPTTIERARMLAALAKVGQSRGRYRDAGRLLGQALEIAVREEHRAVESTIHEGLGEVRQQEGDWEGAASALRRAVALQEETGASHETLARTMLGLGEALIKRGEMEEAESWFARGGDLAAAKLPALGARAEGGLGQVREKAGNLEAAREHYARAVSFASEAGDLNSYQAYKYQLESLT